MKNIREILGPFKLRLTILALMGGATLLSVGLFRYRVMVTDGSLDFSFLIWNLFLAWIPLCMAYITSVLANKRSHLLILIPAAMLWLLFFPNAPYILTDLLHLRRPRPEMPLWYDVLMLIWFAWTGLQLGLFSLYLMHDIVKRLLGRAAGWLFVSAIGVLGSIGIYVGRFLRWNSWDLIFHPLQRLSEFMVYAINPSHRAIMFASVFSAFFIFVYISLYAFGLLFHEQARQVPQEIS